MKHIGDVVRALAELPARFPVEQWTVAGLHVWPLVRYEVARSNFDLLQRGPRATRSGRLPQLGRHLARSAAQVVTGRGRLLPSPAEVLLYSDGVSYVSSGEGAYDRFTDPVRALALDAGFRVLTVVPHGQFVHARDERPLFVQGYSDVTQLVAAAVSRLPMAIGRSLPDYDAAVAELSTHGVQHSPTAQTLERIARQIEVHALSLQALLALARPRVAFLPSYIGTERMAFALACRRAGVPCVDLQHGAAGHAHWAYGGFGRAPAGGYGLVPQYFWAWTQEDADAITAWSHGVDHAAVVAGVPLLLAWQQGAVPGAAAARRALAARADRADREVCFVLSGYELPRVLDEYVAVVRAAPGVFAWFRTHPLRPTQAEEIEKRVSAAGLKSRCEVRISSEVPLYAVLERVRATVLELSSVAFEAALFGVRSLLWRPGTGELYETLTRQGLALHVPMAALPAALGSVERGTPTGPSLEDCRRGAARLISLSGRR